MRVVLDPNVIVSAALKADGVPARIVGHWLAGRFEVVISPMLLEEVERVMARPRIAGRVPAPLRAEMSRTLEALTVLVDDPDPAGAWSRDPKDDYLIGLALAATAILVSGDEDVHSAACPVPVLRPRELLDRLDPGDG